jgi:hypothetical protein
MFYDCPLPQLSSSLEGVVPALEVVAGKVSYTIAVCGY